MAEEKKKRVMTSGVRIFQSVAFRGDWVFVVYDKQGDIISEGGFDSEASCRVRIGRLRKVFKNRFMSIKFE